MKHVNNKHTVEVDFTGFKNLLIWTKPGAEYLCIEPWNGLPDYLGFDKTIENKKDIITVSKGNDYSLNHIIKFD